MPVVVYGEQREFPQKTCAYAMVGGADPVEITVVDHPIPGWRESFCGKHPRQLKLAGMLFFGHSIGVVD